MHGKLTSQEIEALVSRNYIAYLSCCDGDTPYIVPITYYYDASSSSIIGYTTEGKKIEILRKNPKISMIVSEIKSLSEWKTVVLDGTFEELKGMDQITAIKTLSTELTQLISKETQQDVMYINEVARIDGDDPKVIYRIHLENKKGRFEMKEEPIL